MTSKEKSAELVPVSVTDALAGIVDDPWQTVDDGLDGMEHIGYTFPLLRPDMRLGAGWVDETTGEKRDEFDLIWLASKPSRAWYEDDYGKGGTGNAPDCRSADMLYPDPTSPKRQAENCADCVHAKWNNETGAPPACSTRLNVLVYDLGAGHLARTWFSGTSLGSVKRYLSALKVHIPPRPPMSVVTHVTSEQVEKDGKRWLQAVLSAGERIAFEDARPLVALQAANLPAWREQVAVDTAAHSDDEIVDAEIVPNREPFPE